MRTICIFIFSIVYPFFSHAQSDATNPIAGFITRSADNIEVTADRLEQELGDKAMVFDIIGNHDGHSMYLVLRGKTGTSEIHLTESDYYIGIRGTANFVVGGTLINAEPLPRKQVRGTGIEGGTNQAIGPGDIVHVPINTPHHLIIDPENPYMYLLIKLDEEPLN